MTEIMLSAIAGLLVGGVGGCFVAIQTLPYFGRNSSGVSVGFNPNAMATGILVLGAGIIGGGIIGLFVALWLAM